MIRGGRDFTSASLSPPFSSLFPTGGKRTRQHKADRGQQDQLEAGAGLQGAQAGYDARAFATAARLGSTLSRPFSGADLTLLSSSLPSSLLPRPNQGEDLVKEVQGALQAMAALHSKLSELNARLPEEDRLPSPPLPSTRPPAEADAEAASST